MNVRLASPPSLQHFFLDLEEVIPSKRRHSVVEFAVIAERDTRSSVIVIEGTNLNPHPNLSSCPSSCSHSESWSWLGISSFDYHELHLNEGLIQRPLKPIERLPPSSGALDQAYKEPSSAQTVDWIIRWYELVQQPWLPRSEAKEHEWRPISGTLLIEENCISCNNATKLQPLDCKFCWAIAISPNTFQEVLCAALISKRIT